MHATVDGTRIFYLTVGPDDNYPLFVLHGGPGLDHTGMHPWMDPLSDSFQLIYLDLRGHGRSERQDPRTLTLSRYALDISELARIIGVQNYAVLGHSYGAFITLAHAKEQGDASHYVISGGSASMGKSMKEIHENLANFEPAELRDQVTESWALEPDAQTHEDVAKLLRMQMPFHFASTTSDAYENYISADKESIYTPEIIAWAAANEYPLEYENELRHISKPVLIMTGESDRTTTPAAARILHDGIAGSEMTIVPDAGHMTFVEQPDLYFHTVRSFFARHYPPGPTNLQL